MPQDPDTLIPDQSKFVRARLAQVFQRSRELEDAGSATSPLSLRLEGDELVGWVRSGMAIEQKVAEHEAQGIAALRRRGLSLEEWQIDPDGYILPRQAEPSSSGTTPPPATGESTPHSDH